MKGLDNWIMGINDPNAPFNESEWTDYYTPVLDISDWITEEMLQDDKTYKLLGQVFDDVFILLLEKNNTYFNGKEKIVLMMNHAEELSREAYALYNSRK